MHLGPSRNFWIASALIILVTVSVVLLARAYSAARLGAGYMAQKLCSGVLVSGRTAEDVMAENLTGSGLEILRLYSANIDPDAEQVTASLYGLVVETAIYRAGFGCTLLHGESAENLRAQTAGLLRKQPPVDSDAEWPAGNKVSGAALPSGVDKRAVRATIDAMFSEPDTSRLRRTWALVVVHEGRIVAERYAPGFHKDMPLIGWSLSKTATNALVGMRVMDGVLSLADDALMSEWRDKDDPRRSITLDELMRMTSGLEFNQPQDAPWMLFVEPDDAHFAASKPLAYSPGSHWSYSSGNTNIIARILRETFTDEREYLRFPQERLFGPLGMRTASLAPDDAGTFVSSAFLYASARDWARLALLYLRDGVWEGQRLLPEGWVENSLRATKESPDQQYGAQLWRKLPEWVGPEGPLMPRDTYFMLGRDAYYMLGFHGQVVAISPSRDLIVVRLGLTRDDGRSIAWDLAPLVRAFPDKDVQ
jgi:CubicO group peptidase (beta-lactamase class C family)